ncbi:MAG: prepilin-type N-terminal cleavage/methylation domain-containing protein [Phycisphaerales bacterium]|nr:prepilin-type N-terminal cleavage/methylation domain-containing protein [Phycisphaerales bacterium]
MHRDLEDRRRPSVRRGFTLIELLVVMGLIALLGTITIVSLQNIFGEARLSSATNTVVSSLGNARALAMKNNRVVGIVFVVNWDPERPDQSPIVEIVTAQYNGDSTTANTFGGLIDRFDPVPGVPRRRLPGGTKVAGPWYDLGFQAIEADDADDTGGVDYRDWVTQPSFPPGYTDATSAEEGRFLGVMFGPTGEVLTRRSDGLAGRNYAYVDLNGNGQQDCGSASASQDFWRYDEPGDESRVNFVPYIAVFDERAARELYPNSEAGGWVGPANWDVRRNQISKFVNEFADRIHFNRYTGVVMR